MLGLRLCARAFCSCGKRGPLFIAVRGPLTIAASLVAEHRLQTRRLSSCGSRAQLLRGILPDQGSNPCPLHWQADSQPLHHQGSPWSSRFYIALGQWLRRKDYIYLIIQHISFLLHQMSVRSDCQHLGVHVGLFWQLQGKWSILLSV